jgi:hypothetical protein
MTENMGAWQAVKKIVNIRWVSFWGAMGVAVLDPNFK